MPLYEYRCEECRNPFEILVASSKDQVEAACPQCGSKRVIKTISAANFRLSSSSGGKIPAGALSGCSSGSGFS